MRWNTRFIDLVRRWYHHHHYHLFLSLRNQAVTNDAHLFSTIFFFLSICSLNIYIQKSNSFFSLSLSLSLFSIVIVIKQACWQLHTHIYAFVCDKWKESDDQSLAIVDLDDASDSNISLAIIIVISYIYMYTYPSRLFLFFHSTKKPWYYLSVFFLDWSI